MHYFEEVVICRLKITVYYENLLVQVDTEQVMDFIAERVIRVNKVINFCVIY